MTVERMQDILELRNLVDRFSDLADVKDAAGQGELFLPDGALVFQLGDGAPQTISGREALVKAFAATIDPCKTVYHINGQQVVNFSEDGTEADGTAYCVAILVNEESGHDVRTTNYVRYTDRYRKVDGHWYIAQRRTHFVLSDRQPAPAVRS